MNKSIRTANPLATRAKDAYPCLVNGQFINPHGQPAVVPKTGYIGVTPPQTRGARVTEVVDPQGDGSAKVGRR